ncbi:MAG: hypothetical protein M1508_14375 [Nitrospirae bacterium]|nr:hypothetical protein [Nitrospirota bacterium]MCL5421430.1 hypothetical protein [Nitrospirota bacterium]
MDAPALFDIFKIAIENERATHNLYMHAAADAPDAYTKKLFEELAAMELNHEKKLEKCYKELKEKSS